MANKDGKNVKIPSLVSDKEMEDIQGLLADSQFRRYKYLMNDLQRRFEEGDFDGVRAIRESALNDYDKIIKADSLFKGLVTRLTRAKEQVFRRFRREKQFVDRVRHMISGKEKEKIIAFPIGKRTEKKPQEVVPIVKEQEEAVPSVLTQVPLDETVQTEEPSPALSPLADYKPEKEPVVEAPIDVSIEESASTLQHEIVSMGISSSMEAQSTLSDELPSLPKSPADEPSEEPVKAAPQLPKKKVKKKRKKPVKKVEKDTDKEQYYKDRQDRIQDYINKEQQRGSIDIQQGD